MKVGDVCSYCELECLEDVNGFGIDPCLGRLPGVRNACCGHGHPAWSYIMFENQMVIRQFLLVEADLGFEGSVYNWMTFPQPPGFLNVADTEGLNLWLMASYVGRLCNNMAVLAGHSPDPTLWAEEVVGKWVEAQQTNPSQ